MHPRTDIRKRSFLGGRVVFNHGRSTLDCLIRDISSSGARLEFKAVDTLPDEFDLLVPVQERRYRAKLIWRRSLLCGIRFV